MLEEGVVPKALDRVSIAFTQSAPPTSTQILTGINKGI
jgi:hypothetical protein